ncbi:MAG TPA: adenosylcobinamide amidohydrolase [Selenomonadales bacterium]|nr:adenosylcobinamide amidohydrolase [Selenomonadales bacterium]
MASQLLITGGVLDIGDQSILCRFPSPCLVLSTSAYNGGYLLADAVFNQRLGLFVDSEGDLPGGSLENYLAAVAAEHGLNRERSTGLLTSARMECRGYSAITFRDTVVEVVATAGVNENAARAGDFACYYEDPDCYQPLGGTINLLAFTNISLPRGAMAKALLSITEAKAAALQELAVVSPSTLNPATGTGTDGVILACDPAANVACRDAGTQSKLGELFCRATKAAVKQSLARECQIDPRRQGSAAERLRRLELQEINGDGLFEEPRANVLLAMSQAVWQEYRWGLLGLDELYHFLALLDVLELQPFGARLSSGLRRRMAAAVSDEP